jgi:hypothetical protein
LRANIGDIVTTDTGQDFILGLLKECEQVAVANAHPPNPAKLTENSALLGVRQLLEPWCEVTRSPGSAGAGWW